MSSVSKLYAGRLSGMIVRGPDTEPIGRVRDVIISVRSSRQTARVLGLVVELVNNRRIFLPMLRIAAIDPKEITLVSGSVSLRSFATRPGELSAMNDLIGSRVHVDDPELENLRGKAVEIADVEIEKTRSRDWVISRVAVLGQKRNFGRRGDVFITPWSHVQGISAAGVGQSNADAELIAQFGDMRPVDIANTLHDMNPAQRRRVAEALDDDRLADVLQEMPEEQQTELIESLGIERAADVLEEMDPDDAADLLGELSDDKAGVLLEMMDPEESRCFDASDHCCGGSCDGT